MNAQRSLSELEMKVQVLTKKYKHEALKLNRQSSIDFDLHIIAPLIRAMEELLKEYVARYDQHRKEIKELETGFNNAISSCKDLEEQNEDSKTKLQTKDLTIKQLKDRIIELEKPIKTTDELVDGFNKELAELQEQNANLQARLLDLENKLTNKDMTLCRLDREKQELIKQVQKLDEVLTTSQPITREMLKQMEQEHSHKYDNAPPEPCSFEELVGEPMANENTDPFIRQVIEEMESPETIKQFGPLMNQDTKMSDIEVLNTINEILKQPEQTKFSTGAVRSTDANSTRYDLISPVGLRRIAETYAEGAKKYGDNNWQKGMPASDTMNHAIRHLNLWLSGDKTEDHLAHAAWNLIAIMHFEELKPECIDVPTRRTT